MQKKFFGRHKEPLADLPYLAEMQINSYKWFLEKGFRELLDEFSPIEDTSGRRLQIEFLDYVLDKPTHDEQYVKQNNLTYEAPLRVKTRLTNEKTGEVKTQEIFFADSPLMTESGTFIINGIERVIVSQLARSFGVYFTAHYFKGQKRFGAKVIPGRGVWLEFESDGDGAIWVKIDRKRKIAATTLLRIFGLDDNEAIKNALSDVDNGDVSFIEATLKKDQTKTADDSYVEIYKRIRPGEMAALDNAKGLISAMFSAARYDLHMVGRYKMNLRFKQMGGKEETSRVLTRDDLVLILREIIRKNNTLDEMEDDIDHLGHRRVRGVGEMLQSRLRVGLARMERNIHDRISTIDADSVTPSQLINARPFMSVLKEFFTTNQLSQFMDQVNVLSQLEHKRRLSALGPGGLTRERAGFEVRDVHPSHYGRICPIETPEGPNIGLVGHLATYARVNDFGLIETPYRKVSNGVITDEVHYLTAFEETQYAIAHAGVLYDERRHLIEDEVEARVKGQPKRVPKNEVNYIDVSTNQAFSVATGLIPFLGHDDANRALMGSNMQRQAVPCIKPQQPRVATGVEKRAAEDSGLLILAEDDGKVTYVDARTIIVRTGRHDREYNLTNFARSNQVTALHHTPLVRAGERVVKGQPLADNSSTKNGELALGQNLLVAFLSWGGATFEDAIIISERLVKDDRFTSIHIEEFTIDVRDTKLGEEITTHDIPNVGEEKLKDLDEDGVVRVGAEVQPGDILVGKISPKGESDLTPEERLLRAIFGEKAKEVKDSSLRMPHGKRGRIVGIKVFSRERGDRLETGVIKRIHIEVAQLRKISVGDKLAGRHGNKGVISKVLPEQDMPYLADGTPVDIILNPLGVASRMNIGQILETHLGWAAEKLNYQAICPPFIDPTEAEIKEELKRAGIPESGKVQLFDGRTGECFEQDVMVGQIHMLKLAHMVEDKIHMRSIGPYSLITQQPLGGKAQGGGQRFGEMEVWALEGYGAAHTLQEMITIKSDDVIGRAAIYDAIVRGEKLKNPRVPASFYVLVNELKGLALNIIIKQKEPEFAFEEQRVRERVMR
ncbi:MAG: DNA-directed RNA polymerase subunit beta [Candidatus Ryanbacteria bacterium]|nr:DNA-directed RNA polymerase subunit beta [Candidatus Ryanbacteria bacterium]